MTNSLYEKLKEMGVDMAWYERSKRDHSNNPDVPIPLNDDRCGMLSIYSLNKLGSLYTTTAEGEPYQQVRDTGKKIARDIFICMACNKQFNNYQGAKEHYDETKAND